MFFANLWEVKSEKSSYFSSQNPFCEINFLEEDFHETKMNHLFE